MSLYRLHGIWQSGKPFKVAFVLRALPGRDARYDILPGAGIAPEW